MSRRDSYRQRPPNVRSEFTYISRISQHFREFFHRYFLEEFNSWSFQRYPPTDNRHSGIDRYIYDHTSRYSVNGRRLYDPMTPEEIYSFSNFVYHMNDAVINEIWDFVMIAYSIYSKKKKSKRKRDSSVKFDEYDPNADLDTAEIRGRRVTFSDYSKYN